MGRLGNYHGWWELECSLEAAVDVLLVTSWRCWVCLLEIQTACWNRLELELLLLPRGWGRNEWLSRCVNLSAWIGLSCLLRYCLVKDLRWLLLSWSPASDCLNLLDLQVWLWLFLVLLTESFVFFVDIHDKFLNVVTSDLIFVEVPRTDAKMKRLIALFLSWPLFESWTFTSESELDNLLLLLKRWSFAANLNDSLHVATFCSN